MKNSKCVSPRPFLNRGLCVLLAGLTACGPSESFYTRRSGPGLSKLEGRSDNFKMVETWGSKAPDRTISDPEVAPGWLFTLHSFADPKLDGDYRIEFNGELRLPYDVKIVAAGMKLSQLKTKIAEQLRPFYKSKVDVDLGIKERHYWVDVRGLVVKPGRYLVEAEASLDQIIGIAGGFIRETPPQYVRIQKDRTLAVLNLNQYYSRTFENTQILGWYGGEEIFFQKDIMGGPSERVSTSTYQLPLHIVGEVRNPGDYPIIPGTDYVDALISAGGFTDRADEDRIQIIRRTPTGKRIYNLTWDGLGRAPAPLQGDIVVVRSDTTTRTDRRITMFAALISVAASMVSSTILVLAYRRGSL